MIVSLDDAWAWYESAKKLLLAMRCLGDKHWNDLGWEGELGRDNGSPTVGEEHRRIAWYPV